MTPGQQAGRQVNDLIKAYIANELERRFAELERRVQESVEAQIRLYLKLMHDK